MHNTILEAFSRWFASAAGVWQTFLVTLGVVFVEFAYPDLDPNHFGVLFWLTVYSGVTQPALAYVAVQADNKMDKVLRHIEELAAKGVALDEQELHVIRMLAKK